jgi:hypothetical protein
VAVRIRFVVAAALVALVASGCSPAEPHPTGAFQHVHGGKAVPAAKWSWSTTVPAGGDVSVTLGPFHNIRTYDVTLVSVTPIDGDGSVSVVGVDVAGPGRSGGAVGGGSYPAFPPADPALGDLVPAAGFVLPGGAPLTDAGYGLVVGLQTGTKARSLINGFHIVYQAEGLQYAYNEPAYIALCTAPTTCSQDNG